MGALRGVRGVSATAKVPRTVTWVDGRAATFSAVHATPTDSFLSFALAVTTRATVAADAACGRGAWTVMLASRAGKVFAADADEKAVRAAARECANRGVKNVECYLSDLEKEEWSAWTPEGGVDLVTMHLFASAEAFRRARSVLKPGGVLVVAALAGDQWMETRAPPRFAYSPDELRSEIEGAGLAVDAIVNDLVFVNAPGFDVLEQVYFEDGRHPIVAKWKADGRWDGLARSFAEGARGLTESRLVARARRA